MRIMSYMAAAITTFSAAFSNAGVEVMPAPAAAPADITAPWVSLGRDEWMTGEPTFTIGAPEEDPSARGWVAADEQGVRVRVIVHDLQHINTRTAGAIWDGDALQIGFDALAAGVGARDPWEDFVGPTVSAIAFALTSTGPQAWAHYHGRPGGAEARRDLAPIITRDESQKLTIYDLLFPWADYGLQAGVSEAFGLTVQVNDSDPDKPQRRIAFGSGASGTPRPGLFQRIAIARPGPQIAGVSVTRPSLWRRGDSFHAILACFSPNSAKARVTIGDQVQTLDLPASPSGRYLLRGTLEELPATPVPVQIDLLSGDQALASESASIDAPGRFMAELDHELGNLTSAATHPLVARHFATVRAIFAEEWNKAMLYTQTNPEMAAECVQFARKTLTTLKEHPEQFTPERYLNGERGMVFSFIADDRTLQWYHLSLPKGYDPEKQHPTVVYLHGSGNPHALNSVSGVFEPLGAPDSAWVQPVIRIAPWARSNYGYHDIAEADVMKSLANAKRSVKIDEDRSYLMGHSLGGGGTWALALRHPDTWAAAAIVSGVTWFLPTGQGYGANAASLPILIWHGEADGSAANVNQAYEMQKELQAYGNQPEMRIMPGRGHDFEAEDHASVMQWVVRHERKRPDKFTYKMADGAPRGVWGVTMRPGRGGGVPNPSFTCEVMGNTVSINSSDISRFSLNLGEQGLGLSGEVKVLVNGQEAYSGPAKEVEIGSADR